MNTLENIKSPEAGTSLSTAAGSSPYRIVTNGQVFRIQKKIEVGMLWWKRMEWVDRARLFSPLFRAAFPFEFSTEAEARNELERLTFQHFHGSKWEPLNTQDQTATARSE